MEFALIDVRHRRECSPSNVHLIEVEAVLIALSNDFRNKRNPFKPEAVNPEVNLYILAVIEQGADGLEAVVPGIEGHLVCVLLQDEGLHFRRVGIGQFGFLVLVQIAQAPSLHIVTRTEGLLHVMIQIRINFPNFISGHLTGGEPLGNFGLLGLCSK